MSTLALPVYPKMPHMKCETGCGQCCGPVTCQRAEAEAIQAYIVEHSIQPRKNGITCPLYIDGRCSVYEVRPFICRLFGHSNRLVCCKGFNVHIPVKREEKLLAQYASGGKPGFWLHDLAYEPAEVDAILFEYFGMKERGIA